MGNWQEYRTWNDGKDHSVTGIVRVLPDFYSPQLDNRRPVLVYLPPSYDTHLDRRYPTIYMHDGQNLFDAATSYAGEWRVDETLEQLSVEGVEAIVVGLPNMAEERADEYSPFRDQRVQAGGSGEAYIAFLAETVKPMIDETFRTRPQRASTGIMGSSMGGLITLYGFFSRSDVFGLAGVMSPAFWFADNATLDYVRRAGFMAGRIYMDVGTAEMAPPRRVLRYLPFLRPYYRSASQQMERELIRKGYMPGKDLRYVEEPGGEHNEAAWARRLPDALRFLLAGSSTMGR